MPKSLVSRPSLWFKRTERKESRNKVQAEAVALYKDVLDDARRIHAGLAARVPEVVTRMVAIRGDERVNSGVNAPNSIAATIIVNTSQLVVCWIRKQVFSRPTVFTRRHSIERIRLSDGAAVGEIVSSWRGLPPVDAYGRMKAGELMKRLEAVNDLEGFRALLESQPTESLSLQLRRSPDLASLAEAWDREVSAVVDDVQKLTERIEHTAARWLETLDSVGARATVELPDLT